MAVNVRAFSVSQGPIVGPNPISPPRHHLCHPRPHRCHPHPQCVILSEAKRSRRIRTPTALRPWGNGFLHALRLVGMTRRRCHASPSVPSAPTMCHPERSEAKSKDPYPYGSASLGKRIPPRAPLGRNDTSTVQRLPITAPHHVCVILSEATKERSRRIRPPTAVRTWGNGFLHALRLVGMTHR